MVVRADNSSVNALANRIFLFACIVLFFCLILEFGVSLKGMGWYWLRRCEIVCLGLIDLVLIVRLFLSGFKWRTIFPLLEVLIVTVLFIWALLFVMGLAPVNEAMLFARKIFHAYLFLRVAAFLFSGFESGISIGLRPARLMLYGFGGLILVGTVLLSTPNAVRGDVKPWRFTEALLASTSAVCGTGISVRDIGSELTWRGQAALLALMQIGGLGLTTVVLFATYIRQRSLKMKQILALREMMNLEMVGNLGGFLFFVLISTAVLELAGAGILYWQGWRADLPVPERLWWCLFHSVSAFCNNGYSLSKDNMMSATHAPSVLLTLAGVVVVGGIGFPVLYDLCRFFANKLAALCGRGRREGVLRLSIHTRIMLSATAILLVGSTLLFLLFEWSFAFEHRSVGNAFVNAAFEAVSARTAGFNSVDTSSLQNSTYLLLMLLMLIGTGPVSTGGGIKVTTLVVVCLAVRAYLGNRSNIEIGKRTLPASATVVSLSLLLVYASLVILFSMLLMITQSHLPFRDTLFEVISVMSSVGFSSGAVNQFSDLGVVLFCIATLIGRLGPLTLLLILADRGAVQRYKYPQEGILIS